jgi:putative restriction endonuclease
MSSANGENTAGVSIAPGRTWGPIAGIREGTTFASRREAFDRGVHQQTQAGIAGTRERGADSIVVSGGYADRDEGDVIYYTGHGGREGRRHVRDQTFDEVGNAALVTSQLRGTPVRVIRGKKAEFGPESGYQYDGLFFVKKSWYEREEHGFKVCRYLMVKAGAPVDATFYDGVPVELTPDAVHPVPKGNLTPARRRVSGREIVRSAEVSSYVKETHNYTCQMCNVRLSVSGRGYAEGAHIQAVGAQGGGPDVVENMLCLCPNCHALFDLGAILVHDDFTLSCNGQPNGMLRVDDRHKVGKEYLALHRKAHS